MNAETIAKAVKDYLITLAIADKLPLDMTQLETDSLEEVIQSAIDNDDEDVVKNAEAYELAGNYLVGDGEQTIEEMVELIAANEDQDSLIDYVKGVEVWEKVEFEFTCKYFLNLINYTK